MTIFRAVVHNVEVLNRKGSNKHNYCYALTNRLPYKTQTDEEDLKLYEEMIDEQAVAAKQKVVKGLKYAIAELEEDKGPQITEDERRRKQAAFLRNRFESRFLTCPFNVGSFDVFTYTGKSMVQIEREAYKIFEFMEKAFGLDLLYLVSDWIRDNDGNHWFLGVKSYTLTEEGYSSKVYKPSIFDRDMMALNKVKKPTKSNLHKHDHTYSVLRPLHEDVQTRRHGRKQGNNPSL